MAFKFSDMTRPAMPRSVTLWEDRVVNYLFLFFERAPRDVISKYNPKYKITNKVLQNLLVLWSFLVIL